MVQLGSWTELVCSTSVVTPSYLQKRAKKLRITWCLKSMQSLNLHIKSCCPFGSKTGATSIKRLYYTVKLLDTGNSHLLVRYENRRTFFCKTSRLWLFDGLKRYSNEWDIIDSRLKGKDWIPGLLSNTVRLSFAFFCSEMWIKLDFQQYFAEIDRSSYIKT